MTYLFLFILGLAIGSFSNVLIDRLPHDESIMGRSHCDFCKKTLSGGELIPVVSYIIQNGRCRNCHKKLSIQYPLIELWTGVLFVLTAIYISIPFGYFDIFATSVMDLMKYGSFFVIVASLNIIFFTDAKYQLIPDGMQIVLAVAGAIWLYSQGILPPELLPRLVAAVVVMAPILAIFLITKGKGMGFADVKLALTIGFLFGIKGGLIALYVGFLAGAAVGIVLILGHMKKMKSRIAFGPFLIIGMVVTYVFSGPIYAFIHRVYGI